MPHIRFILTDGTASDVACAPGASVMQAATCNALPGIEAVCGGFCNCATCHVYVDETWVARLPPIKDDENDMLEGTASDRLPTSRLACQIIVTADLDGLTVRMPPRQA